MSRHVEPASPCRGDPRPRLSRVGRRSLLASAGVAAAALVTGVLRQILPAKRPSGAVGRAGRGPQRHPGYVGTPEPGGTVLVTPGGVGTSAEQGFRLNAVAAHIWSLADGTRTIDDIAERISHLTGAPIDVARRDTAAFMRVLQAEGLLVEAEG